MRPRPATGSSATTRRRIASLDELAAQLADLGAASGDDGHTDDHGDTAYNQALSEQRAQAVQVALDSRLGDGFTFAVTGHGETQPVGRPQHQ